MCNTSLFSMQKIKFLNNEKVYDVSISFYNAPKNIKRLRIVFTEEITDETILEAGFVELNEHNLRVQGDYSSFINLYKKDDEYSYVLSDTEGDIYTEPEEPEPYVPTFWDIRNSKIKEIASDYNLLLASGIEVELENGIELFPFSESDSQILMSKTLELQTVSSEYIEYKDTLYTRNDMNSIITKGLYFINKETAYKNNLVEYINTLSTEDEVNEILYGQEIPTENINTVYNSYLNGVITEENMSPTRINTMEENINVTNEELATTQLAIVDLYETILA